MAWLLSGMYLALLTAIGYAAMSVVLGPVRRHWAEVAALSFAGGFGLIGVILFLMSLCGLIPNRLVLTAIFVVTAVMLVVLGIRGRLLAPTSPSGLPNRWDARALLGAAAVLLILGAAANVAAESLTADLADVDAYAIWMLKAKVAIGAPLHPVPSALRQPSLSYSHQDYPLNFPLAVAGIYAAIGRVDEQLGKTLLLPIYLSFVLIIYSALRRLLRRADAICITAVLVAAPVIVQHAGMAVAEVPLVLMHNCCLVLLLRWMGNEGRRELIASAAFAAFAAFTKNEGLAMLPVVALATLAVAVARRSRRLLLDWLIAAAVAIVLIVPWLVYRQALPRTHEDYGTKLASFETVAQNLPRLHRILPQYLGLLLQPQTAGGLWLLLGVAALVGWRRFARLPVFVLWGLLLAHLGLYAATFMVTPWELDILLPMVGAKLIAHAAPTAALLIGLHLSNAPDSQRAKTLSASSEIIASDAISSPQATNSV